MATIDGATTVSTAVNKIVSATGLANVFGKASPFMWQGTLPLKNPLADYVTFNYVLSLGALTDNQVSFPDSTYMSGQRIPLVCKTAGGDPSNRINTSYGKFDFYIDNLSMESLIGFESNKNTNVATLSFEVYEPYSMGLFMLALQQAAIDAGHPNWTNAPFLITIDFMGNQQNGTMITVPNTRRYIPFYLATAEVHTNEKGTTYKLSGSGAVSQGLTQDHAGLPSDTSVKGRTVQEVLQSGEKSLQAVVNKRLQQYKDDGIVAVPDEVVIIFPIDTASAASASGSSAPESSSTATTNTSAGAANLYKKIGVQRNSTTKNLVQDKGECNALGLASMGYDLKKKAEVPMGKDSSVYNTKKQIWEQSANTFDVEEGNLKFHQDIDIPTAINQVMIASNYPNYALSNDALNEQGMRPWWRIDPQVFTISTDANYPTTGTKPRLIVYRVVPYDSHSSKLTAPNVKAPGFDKIKQYIVKQYDYIYTGKNTDVLKFNIDLSFGFANVMSADNFSRGQDVQLLSKLAGGLGKFLDSIFGGILGSIFGDVSGAAKSVLAGSKPSTDPGTMPTKVKYTGTQTSTDNTGGGGLSNSITQAAKYAHDAITSELNMAILDLEILGDPYWINQSGLGNYTAKQTQYKDLNADGTVNYQNGEVDILVNFRTPIDINQATGMYNFGASVSETAPVTQFSGLYNVNKVTSTFSKGRFTQVLVGNRRPNQELKKEGSIDQLFNIGSMLDSVTSGISNIFK